MAEPLDSQRARSRDAEPSEGAGDEPGDGDLVSDPPSPPTVETTPVGYPSHYLDPPPETVVWA